MGAFFEVIVAQIVKKDFENKKYNAEQGLNPGLMLCLTVTLTSKGHAENPSAASLPTQYTATGTTSLYFFQFQSLFIIKLNFYCIDMHAFQEFSLTLISNVPFND